MIPDIKRLLSLRFDLFRTASAYSGRLETNSRAGHDGGVIGNLSGCSEILVELGRAHEKHITRIGKTFPAAGISQKLFGQTIILAGKITHGVVILGVGQTTHRDRAGIAHIDIRRLIEFLSHPA